VLRIWLSRQVRRVELVFLFLEIHRRGPPFDHLAITHGVCETFKPNAFDLSDADIEYEQAVRRIQE
jgi:hypothetical protein